MVILDYGNPLYGGDKPKSPQAIKAFANYAAFVVSHFKGKVRLFELENEWETHTGATTPGTPEAYIALAKQVYPAIKRVNDESVLLSGGISDLEMKTLTNGWLDRFFSMGGLAYVDAVSIHPYNIFYPKDEATPEAAIDVVETIHQMALLHSQGRPIDIYITEMGYPTYTGKGGVSEDLAATYLARFMVLAASQSYIRGAWWYGFKDQGTDSEATTDVANKEHHFGLVRGNLQPKAYALMYSALSVVLTGSSTVSETRNGDEYTVTVGAGTGARVIQWRANEGSVMTYLASNPSQSSPLVSLSRLH
jgi:hypothetical protein